MVAGSRFARNDGISAAGYRAGIPARSRRERRRAMANPAAPVVSQWYRHLGKGQEFQVTAIDENDRTVEIQHFDGDVEEVDFDEWYGLQIEAIEPPEDWTGPVDDVERDDLGYTETDMRGADWVEPMQGGGTPDESAGDTEEVPGED
jgi:hypothetical protein